MSTTITNTDTIGEYAGQVYNTLASNGPMSEAQIIKELPNMTSGNVLQGIGWLAREDKLE